MGESARQHPGRDAQQRRGRRSSAGSSVLTPPTGLPALEDLIPTQRAPGDARQAMPPRAVVDPCACGHGRAAHEHYRLGSDCGACGASGCAEFRSAESGGGLRGLLRKLSGSS